MAYERKPKFQRLEIPHHVSESLNHMMERYRQTPGFQLCLLQMRWAEIVGHDVADVIQPTKWYKGVLMVKSFSPSAKFTLSYQMPKIIDKINTHFGNEAITSIRYERYGL